MTRVLRLLAMAVAVVISLLAGPAEARGRHLHPRAAATRHGASAARARPPGTRVPHSDARARRPRRAHALASAPQQPTTPQAQTALAPAPIAVPRSATAAPLDLPRGATPTQRLEAIERRIGELDASVAGAQAILDDLKSNLLSAAPAQGGAGAPPMPSI